MSSRRVDLLPLAAAGLALAIAVTYLVVVSQQGGQPTIWAVVVLFGSSAGAAYAGFTRSPLRRAVLWVSGAMLVALGVYSLPSIGLSILLAGLLCIVSAVRSRRAKDWRETV